MVDPTRYAAKKYLDDEAVESSEDERSLKDEEEEEDGLIVGSTDADDEEEEETEDLQMKEEEAAARTIAKPSPEEKKGPRRCTICQLMGHRKEEAAKFPKQNPKVNAMRMKKMADKYAESARKAAQHEEK
jgi:hypothetical protein